MPTLIQTKETLKEHIYELVGQFKTFFVADWNKETIYSRLFG